MIIYYYAYNRYWCTYNGKITKSGIKEPLGEETIIKLTNKQFDLKVQKGDIRFN